MEPLSETLSVQLLKLYLCGRLENYTVDWMIFSPLKVSRMGKIGFREK